MRFLPEDIDLWLVSPPGREPRDDEPEVERVDCYVDSVTADVLARPALPLAIFGHSLGGVLAYETALRLTAAGRAPTRLFLSACAPPGRSALDDDAHTLPDARLVALMRDRFGGLPVALEDSPDFMALLVRRIRHDLRLLSQCIDRPQPPLATPISVLWSNADPSVTEKDVREWAPRSSCETTFRSFGGGHFFLTTQVAEVVACIAASLSADLMTHTSVGASA